MPRIETKLSPSQTIGISETGQFTARVAAFGNVDSYGDRLMPGCFEASLEEKAAANKTVPILWSHDWLSVPIGFCAKAYEDPDGLIVEGQLLLADPRAQSVHALMRERAVTEFSFGFVAAEADLTIKWEDGEYIRELGRVDLVEVSPVLYPANDSTELLSIRSAPLAIRSGATLSASTKRRLSDMRSALLTVAEELGKFLEDPTGALEERQAPAGAAPLRLSLAPESALDPDEPYRRIVADHWPRL
jgi:HK97 family phage prohead protease